MQTNHSKQLQLTKLPPAAQQAFSVKGIQHNLEAISELHDANHGVYFSKHCVEIEHNEDIML